MNDTSPAVRARYINGLRDLASFLDTHLGFPVPPYETTIHIFPDGASDAERRASVDRLAVILDATPADKNGHYIAAARFGPVTYEAVAISDAARAAHHAGMSYADSVRPDEPGTADIASAA
jgi:hypothetical protein